MDLDPRPSECVKVYADSLRKTIRLLTAVPEMADMDIERLENFGKIT